MTKLNFKRSVFSALAFLGLVVAGSPGPKSQSSDALEKTFSVEELRQDLKVLWDVLDEGHGGFERYTPRETLKKRFDEASGGLTIPMSAFDFYRRLLPLIAEIKDGHTSLSLPASARTEFFSRQVFFPFELRFIEGKAYLFRNFSEVRNLKDGAEVLEINGAPMKDILAKLLDVVPCDAGILSRRLKLLENPSLFGQNYAVVIGPAERFRLRMRTFSGVDIRDLTVPAIASSSIGRIRAERYPETGVHQPLYELGYRSSTAVITIRGFGDDRGPGTVAYPEFIQKTFRELADKKIETLIIDVRGNGGGQDEYGRSLFAHFMDEPFLYYKALEVKKNRFDILNTVAGGSGGWPGDAVRKNARGWYDVLDHPNVGTMKPETPRFMGRTCILVDGLSFSTTGETTSLFHYHKKAVFLGEECGAGYYGNTSGSMPLVTLPKTGIQLRLPLVLYTLAVDGYPTDRGIVPDYPVTPTIEDLLAGRDVVMEKALSVLAKK